MDQALIHELAKCPPNVWAQRVRQAAIINPLLSECATSQDIEDARAELGVTRRRVRQLMEFARQREEGADPRGHETGFGLWLGDAQESLIDEALCLAGEDAPLKAVCDLISDLSRKRQVVAPSIVTVRHRYNATRSRKRSFAPLNLDCDAALDLAPLHLAVFDKAEAPRIAWLLISFDSKTTHVLDFEIFSGRPVPSVLSRRIRSLLRDNAAPTRYGATNTILKTLEGARSQLLEQMKSASLSRSLTAGAVTRAAFGLRIGKIKLLADTRALGKVELPPVSHQVARDVIGYLLGSVPIAH